MTDPAKPRPHRHGERVPFEDAALTRIVHGYVTLLSLTLFVLAVCGAYQLHWL